MVYTFFDKKLSDDSVKNENRTKELATELHKPIRNFADLADMELLSKLIKVFSFLLCY